MTRRDLIALHWLLFRAGGESRPVVSAAGWGAGQDAPGPLGSRLGFVLDGVLLLKAVITGKPAHHAVLGPIF